MNTKGSVIILILYFFTLFSLTDCNDCENKVEGESLDFQLGDSKKLLQDDDRFNIKKDNKFIVPKRNRKQSGPGIVNNNLLVLPHVNLSDSGKYIIEVFDVKGTNKISYTKEVCVYAKVPKPKVNVTCLEKNAEIRCEFKVDKDQGKFDKWHKNGKEINKPWNFTTQLDDPSSFTCTVHNPADKRTSDPVKVNCIRKLFGFDFWLMVGILAGGGCLVLLLLLMMVICSCRACKRRERRLRDEEELRLNYHNLSQASGQQKSKQTARGQPAPPEPYDDVSAQDIPSQEHKTRNQPRARPPPPPIDDEEEQPPPLPQPRKNAQVKRHEESY